MSESQRELLVLFECPRADATLAQRACEVFGVAMHRVDLVRARALHDIHELVEVAVVGEVERRIGAKQPRELRILGPTRNQRGAVAPQTTPDLVLSDRRSEERRV